VRTSTGGRGGRRSFIAGPRGLAPRPGRAGRDVSVLVWCPPRTPSL